MKTALFFSLFFIISSGVFSQEVEWKAPEKANELKNPIVLSDEVLLMGRNLYLENCAVCHGEVGKGDGEAVASLDVKPADLTRKELMEQGDGALFWKISTGKSPMVTFQGALKDEEIWHVIHYIKALPEPEHKN
ncbi:MAG: c-type cytochrome [Candidatus Cyclobacteriaceae bacterium M2_1C_046]